MPTATKRDPRLRKRGGRFVCAICGKELPPLCVKDSDPFCSTECARSFHNNPMPRGFEGRRKGT